MIHSIPVDQCPFDGTLANDIEAARFNVVNGLVDEDDFDDVRQGRSAEDLFRELLINRPAEEDLVFTHGDYCLPNMGKVPKQPPVREWWHGTEDWVPSMSTRQELEHSAR